MNFVVLGKSGSGKTELVKILTEQFKYEKIVTYTTRPIRDGEVDGVDYNFISLEQFKDMLDKDEFVEYFVAGNGWHYGTKKDSFNDDDMVIILTPSGLQALKDNEIDIVSFYIDVDDKERYIRQILRGDNINEIARRSNTDEEDFKGIESKVSYVIENNTNNIWDCVISTLSKISEKR